MPRYDHRKCEDEDDAARMAESLLRELGYMNAQKGVSRYDVSYDLTTDVVTMRKVAQTAERIARWARTELKRRGVTR